ncbi:hypothetical protein CRYUN_Cryun15aG0100800 [Craigia yunnanensis]
MALLGDDKISCILLLWKSKSSFSAGPRYGESEFDSLSKRYRNEELPETWYNQFIDKYRLTRPCKLSFGDRGSEKRTPEEMTTYLRIHQKHKRRRVAFQEDQYMRYGNTGGLESNSVLDGNNSADDDTPFFLETMFMMSCSPVIIERLGIRPEYLNMELVETYIVGRITGSTLVRNKHHRCLESNFGTLAELVKDSTRNVVLQTQQQMHGIQSQLQPQHQNALRMAQQLQMTRQMHPQMQQLQEMVHPKNLTFQQQQQLERMRRCHPSTPRPVMDADKERPMVQVKIENPSELPMDSNAFNPINTRHPQMQFRQQQLAAISNLHAQSSNQLRQLMNMGIVGAPPVKVEGFQELMGGDTTLKHDSDENKLNSPPNK